MLEDATVTMSLADWQEFNSQLRKAKRALEPFARLAKDPDMMGHGDNSTDVYRLRAGDLRKAREIVGC